MLFSTVARGQTSPANAVAEASALRDRGALVEAARMLKAHLDQHPDDGDAARLLAQTLYWLKDMRAAMTLYETALRQHPEDFTLQLDYGRMLVETRNDRRAVEILMPLTTGGQVKASAESLLGTLAYWQGDLSTAVRHFESALRGDSAQRDARRQLGEILALSAPWVRAGANGRNDDQPLDRTAASFEAGWFPDPLIKLSAHVEPMRFGLGDTLTRTVMNAEAAAFTSVPGLRLQIELAGGIATRSYGGRSSDWTGRAALHHRLPAHFTLGGSYERAPYLYTLASLSTPVTVQTSTALLGFDDPRGWLGEAAFQRQQYSDANALATGYAWLLAPVVSEESARLQLGYAFAAQNANESRFFLAQPIQSVPPGSAAFNLEGRYDPYFTPSNLTSHSAVGALSARMSSTAWLHLNGAYAFHAVQDAPSFVIVASPGASPRVEKQFTRLTFSPWNLRATLAIFTSSGFGLDASGEYAHTAFYSAYIFAMGVTYRFTGAALRRADRF